MRLSSRVVRRSALVISLGAFGLGRPAAAAPVVHRNGNTMTWTEGAPAAVRQASGSPELVARLLKATFTDVSQLTCEELFQQLFDALNDGFPEGKVSRTGGGTCSESPTGKAMAGQETLLLEAMTVDDGPALDAYLAMHQGQLLFGVALDFRRVFGLLIDAMLVSADQSAANGFKELSRLTTRRFFANRQAEGGWFDAASRAVNAPDIADLLVWVGQEYGLDSASALHDRVLPMANLVYLFPQLSLVMEDHTLEAGPFGQFVVRDCHPTAFNDRCL